MQTVFDGTLASVQSQRITRSGVGSARVSPPPATLVQHMLRVDGRLFVCEVVVGMGYGELPVEPGAGMLPLAVGTRVQIVADASGPGPWPVDVLQVPGERWLLSQRGLCGPLALWLPNLRIGFWLWLGLMAFALSIMGVIGFFSDAPAGDAAPGLGLMALMLGGAAAVVLAGLHLLMCYEELHDARSLASALRLLGWQRTGWVDLGRLDAHERRSRVCAHAPGVTGDAPVHFYPADRSA
ncbi:MAG: hypothetical protein Q4G71_14375 [Pseudomonadota bacterium]|nr:hypothetical protein [Pseudomonadota bacterium]